MTTPATAKDFFQPVLFFDPWIHPGQCTHDESEIFMTYLMEVKNNEAVKRRSVALAARARQCDPTIIRPEPESTQVIA